MSDTQRCVGEDSPFVLSGTKVVAGYGSMLVLAVGTDTEWGRTMSVLGEEDEERTPLQVQFFTNKI